LFDVPNRNNEDKIELSDPEKSKYVYLRELMEFAMKVVLEKYIEINDRK